MTAVVVVQTGKAFIADQVSPAGGGTATFYIGWGTGGSSTGGTATNTDLDLRARATEAFVTATTEDQPSADTCRWIGIVTCQRAGGYTVEEGGLFYIDENGGTATGLIIRISHNGVALATDENIQYTFTMQISGTTT